MDADSGLCLSCVRTLDPKRNLDHRSFFILDRYVNVFIQIISFSERSLFKLRCETVIGIVLGCCHQGCCLLYYLGEINTGIHMYQFTLKHLHFCFQMWFWFWTLTKILADRRIWRQKGTDQRICILLFTPVHMVKVCCGLTRLRFMSQQHCDDT